MFTTSTLQSIFWPKESKLLKESLLILGAALILSLSSQINIPLQPVPLTFQSVTVLLIGMALGARLGLYSICTYLIAGSIGLPIFAEWSGGFHVFVGPTAGYLIGFLPAVLLTGFLAQKGFAKSILSSFISASLGAIIIFAFGVIYLAQFTGWENAFLFGVKPFLISEPIKLIILALFIPRCWKDD